MWLNLPYLQIHIYIWGMYQILQNTYFSTYIFTPFLHVIVFTYGISVC